MTHGSDGRIWIRDELQIGTGTSMVTIGYLKNTKWNTSDYLDITYLDSSHQPISENELKNTHQVINAANKFIVHEDGSMVATDGIFTGTIYATGGKIGNMEIESLVDPGYEVAIEIKENSGTVFESSNETKTLIAILYNKGQVVTDNIISYQWYKDNEPIPDATKQELVVNEKDVVNFSEFTCKISKE